MPIPKLSSDAKRMQQNPANTVLKRKKTDNLNISGKMVINIKVFEFSRKIHPEITIKVPLCAFESHLYANINLLSLTCHLSFIHPGATSRLRVLPHPLQK